MMLVDIEKWEEDVEKVLRHWKDDGYFAKECRWLLNLSIVQKECDHKGYRNDDSSKAKALRSILSEGINSLGVSGEKPPVAEDDSRWEMIEWRHYSILRLQYVENRGREVTASRICLSGAGTYNRYRKDAIKFLASYLRAREGVPESGDEENSLAFPVGPIKLQDPYYIERPADAKMREATHNLNQIVTIRGSRQMGKTSLLIRSRHELEQRHSAKVIFVDFQRLDHTCFKDLDSLLYQIGESIVIALELDIDEVERAWESQRRTPGRKLEYLMNTYIWPSVNVPLVLAFDEADRLLVSDFRNDFFGMLRGWYNLGALDDTWRKLSMILVISVEPFLLVDNFYQSPFNVGRKLELSDFTDEQVHMLVEKYDLPAHEVDICSLISLLGGHPFLTRMALYQMKSKQLSWSELDRLAATEQGPFAEHLRYLYGILNQNPSLRTAFKNIIKQKGVDNLTRYRFLKAGLVKEVGDIVVYRCELYRRYFSDKLS